MTSQRWRPPPFRRRAASTRERYRKQGLCADCGAGAARKADRIRVSPHHPHCPTLKRIVAMERRGICSQCGARKGRLKGFNDDWQLVEYSEWCPNGHGREYVLRPPTADDIAELGLVAVDGSAP